MGRGAYFVFPFFRIGLIPDAGILYHLPRRVGLAAARQILLVSQRAEADVAVRIGLADMVVDDDRVQNEALDLADKLGAHPAQAFALTKRLLNDREPVVDGHPERGGRCPGALPSIAGIRSRRRGVSHEETIGRSREKQIDVGSLNAARAGAFRPGSRDPFPEIRHKGVRRYPRPRVRQSGSNQRGMPEIEPMNQKTASFGSQDAIDPSAMPSDTSCRNILSNRRRRRWIFSRSLGRIE